MKIIIPMAGMGKRMRPHTLTVPKPLIPVAGKPIVQRLVEDLSKTCTEKIEEIAFIIGDFGKDVEKQLCQIAIDMNITPKIYYQKEPLGTAHAVLCAAESLEGKVIVAFADTLFRADFQLETNDDGIIWVHKVDNPSSFGVVKTNNEGIITDFIEKPKEFVSDLAIIGIYYFNNGKNLKNELQFLIDNNISVKGEFQLTDALQNMKNKGLKLKTNSVKEWFDCGNKQATLQTSNRILELVSKEELISVNAKIINSVIIPPCFIDKDVTIENCVIGPHLSIGKSTIIKNSIINSSIIQQNSKIEDVIISNSMIGNFTEIKGNASELNIGDYTNIYN